MIRRRAIATLTTLLAGAATGVSWHRSRRRRHALEDLRMKQDFAEGDIFHVGDWFVSRYEVEVLELRGPRPFTDS